MPSARPIRPSEAKPAHADAGLPLERFVTFALLRLTNRLNRQAMHMVSEASNLRLPEWRCLALVCAGDGVTLAEIVERTGLDGGLITRSAQGLVEKGFLLVARDTKDRRIVRATATAQGMRLYRQVLPVMQARQARLLGALTEADRSALYRIVDRLNRCLDDWPQRDAER